MPESIFLIIHYANFGVSLFSAFSYNLMPLIFHAQAVHAKIENDTSRVALAADTICILLSAA